MLEFVRPSNPALLRERLPDTPPKPGKKIQAATQTFDLESEIVSALHELDTNDAALPASLSHNRDTMRTGLLALLGRVSLPNHPAWDDAVRYCLTTIASPDDASHRANASWARSYSDVCKLLLSRFDDEIVAAAHEGTRRIARHYSPKTLLDISHVDKKQNFLKHFRQEPPPQVFQHNPPSVLATACYELTILCCAVTQSAWLPTALAVESALITNASICDDYHAFTRHEARVRVYMVALSLGAAYHLGGQAVNILVDATALQAIGQRGPGAAPSTIETALAWRAVSGCATCYSAHPWTAQASLEEGLVGPEVMMATHDLFDWRSDAAAGNHENGVFAVYGLLGDEGETDPFHAYLEAMLRRASFHPVSGAYAIAGAMGVHWTSSRYGSYRYYAEGKGEWAPCAECERLTRKLTADAGLSWDPQPPPASFASGSGFRDITRAAVDRPADTNLAALAQRGIGWFQHLIVSGRIRVFDALVELEAIDPLADWV